MRLNETLHLAYSLNVFPAEGWDGRFGIIRDRISVVRSGLNDLYSGPFGLGLWLDNRSSLELSDKRRLADFRDFLNEEDLYVFTVNAFPYGDFHSGPVKENVYLPDWRSDERVEYTIRVADILAELLPEGVEGSISTVPGSGERDIGKDGRQLISSNLARVARHLSSKDRNILLGVEMEPGCLWESPGEFIAFRETCLDDEQAAKYIGICYDTCHQELLAGGPGEGLRHLLDKEVPIAKIQFSAALEAPDADSKEFLNDYADSIYLHQTRVCSPGKEYFKDIPRALEMGDRSRNWIVHCHMPVYLEDAGNGLKVRRSEIDAVLRQLNENPNICPSLEIETYTYNYLPANLRPSSIEDGIVREYRWLAARMPLHRF